MTDIENEMLQKETILKYIILAGIPRIGPVGQNGLLEISRDINRLFEMSEEKLLDADKDGFVGRNRISLFVNGRADEENRNKAESVYSDCESKGIRIITKESSEYPKRFAGIQDMPILLYVNGTLRINEYTNAIGIIGARRCSVEGKEKAISVATESIENGGMVISGMAKGIDSYAQTAALKTAGYTIAVLGNGPDVCYPKEHQALFDAIAKQGCVLSEYPPGTIPHRYMFPRRNRIIAGLSDEIYVIDAGRKSGTESTVEYSKKYGRRIEVIDGVNYPDEEKTMNDGEKNMTEVEIINADEKAMNVEEKSMNEERKATIENRTTMEESETLLNKTEKFGDVELIPADPEKVKEEEKQIQNKENVLWEKLRIEFELHFLEGEIKAHMVDKELIEKKLEESLQRKANLEKRLEEIGEA